MKTTLDTLDKRIVRALTDDGNLSPGKIAEKLDVTPPTIRSRMKNLIAAGALKVAGLVNPDMARGFTVALVGVSLQGHDLEEKLNAISALEQVNWCAVVTGRYDLIIEVVCADEGDLYMFLSTELGTIGGILSSESFVVMKSRRKWLYLPEAIVKTFTK